MSHEELSREELALRLEAVLAVQLELRARLGAVENTSRLVHELEVHRVELELQNRELREAHAALELSRDRYIGLYDFAPIACFTFDVQGCVEEVNLSGARLVGRARGQLVGRPFLSLVRLQDPARFFAHLRRCLATQASVKEEFRFARPGAPPVDVEVVSVPVVVEGADLPLAVRTAFTDISRRKRAEAEERGARAAEQRLRLQLEAVDRAGLEVATRLANEADSSIEEVLQTIVDQARAIAGAELAALGLVGGPDEAFSPWTFSGVSPELAQAIGRMPRAVGVLGLVMREARTVNLSDLRTHPTFRGLPPGHPDMTSFVGVAIRHAGKVAGHLYLANKQGSVEFSADDVRATELFAERVGFVLEILRLRGLQRREAERLALLAETGAALPSSLELAATMQAVARFVIPTLADYSVLYLVEGEHLRAGGVAHRDPVKEVALARLQQAYRPADDPQGVFARVHRTGKPELVPDYVPPAPPPGMSPELAQVVGLLAPTSMVIVPVIAHTRRLGILCCFFAESGRHHDAADLALIEQIAARAALAVENARLYQDAQAAVLSRDALLEVVSHDLRNPLSGIGLNAAVLARLADGEGGSARVRTTAARIGRGVARSNRLIDDLLTVSCLDAGRFTIDLQPERVDAIVDEAVESLAPIADEAGLRLEWTLADDLPPVLCDRGRILQVLSNLVGNAAKATSSGWIRIAAERSEALVRLSVSDTGPGIPEAQQGSLFDRYWRGQFSGRKGVGLGLFIVRGVVEAHGGKVWVDSKLGLGTTFFFTLPVAPPG